MKKEFKQNSSLVPSQDELDTVSLFNKIQQQLFSLEKKIDILIRKSSERTFEGKSFSKYLRPGEHSSRYSKGKQGDSTRERTFDKAICADCKKECEVPFRPSGDRPVYCRDCFSKHKGGGVLKSKYDNSSKDRNFSSGRNFDKRPGDGTRRPAQRNR
ncbi:MAG: CxxC-x17-CxxC domain-containing protein [Candidatus Omnitrophota bacterium]